MKLNRRERARLVCARTELFDSTLSAFQIGQEGGSVLVSWSALSQTILGRFFPLSFTANHFSYLCKWSL